MLTLIKREIEDRMIFFLITAIAVTIIAGVIVYESKSVAHTQYIATTDEGKKEYAVDSILDLLINEYYAEKKYFDFGISTEKNGFYLNEGLIRFKEEFGARAVVHDFYEVDVV